MHLQPSTQFVIPRTIVFVEIRDIPVISCPEIKLLMEFDSVLSFGHTVYYYCAEIASVYLVKYTLYTVGVC